VSEEEEEEEEEEEDLGFWVWFFEGAAFVSGFWRARATRTLSSLRVIVFFSHRRPFWARFNIVAKAQSIDRSRGRFSFLVVLQRPLS
jgi:hypothetical protein